MTAVAVIAATIAVVLLVPGGTSVGRAPVAAPSRWSAALPAVVVLVVLVVLFAWVDRAVLIVSLVGLATTGAGWRLWCRRSASRRADGVRAEVIELCEALQVELGAGQAPADALSLAAHDHPWAEAAARTAGTGGDVPAALRDLAGTPGAADLRVVAAAWQVAHRTGHGLADAVGRVAVELRAAEQTRRVVAGELTSARATARLVAVLPVAALLLGTGAGSDPWSFLFGTPIGWACLAGGLACALAGLAWIERLATGVERDR